MNSRLFFNENLNQANILISGKITLKSTVNILINVKSEEN